MVKKKHAAHAFDGEGARLYGSRWSTPGNRVVFVSETLSLAILEVLVHLHMSPALRHYVVFTGDFSEELVQVLDKSRLPKNWRHFPAPPETQALGDDWIESAPSLLLRVPSAIVPGEHNYLINRSHPQFSQVSIAGPKPLDIDGRVFRYK
ncbi:MAG: RES family NAD+ phosphorylase [Desulfomonile tiedjei]|nr:RES family NAD+ phosphorylase [Desulfomonile tiedjei]